MFVVVRKRMSPDQWPCFSTPLTVTAGWRLPKSHRREQGSETRMWREIGGYPFKAFLVCLFAYATAQMDLALFGYAIPSIRKEFGLSLSGVMTIVSTAFIIGGMLIVWLGLWTDRVGRRG